MPKQGNQSNELNAEEAAAFLGVTVATLYNLIKRGLVKKFKRPYGVGAGARRVFFRRELLQALKDKRTR